MTFTCALCIHTCLEVHVHTHRHTHCHAHSHTNAHDTTHTCTPTCSHAHSHEHTNTHMQTHIHIHVHTHKHTHHHTHTTTNHQKRKKGNYICFTYLKMFIFNLVTLYPNCSPLPCLLLVAPYLPPPPSSFSLVLRKAESSYPII